MYVFENYSDNMLHRLMMSCLDVLCSFTFFLLSYRRKRDLKRSNNTRSTKAKSSIIVLHCTYCIHFLNFLKSILNFLLVFLNFFSYICKYHIYM